MDDQHLDILFEDNHLLVVNKPAGMLVQGDATGDIPLIELAKLYIKSKYEKPGDVFLGLVHRIDRPVSGIVLLARTSKALERMTKAFRERKVEKIYWAIVKGVPHPQEDKLIHWLKKDQQKNITKAYLSEQDSSQYAELSYHVMRNFDKNSLLEVKPITGRPHQIRVQLSSIGCPIVGDLKYGFATPNKDASICLHARKLSFEHPVKKESISIVAPLPDLETWRHLNLD
jgi:23S rRNA pseudouridine1911/1915/1917 synthase